ncbi:unnamed protein product [Cylindrotheca closterium]|uniref:Uncharacterized protein n=1 Tax=Cylindrotheca closterium TaxID=2856 RepID=A0AAD2JKR5_9STRA|nr:unnamed protein product [Cylindrotheca closterium]
MRSSNSAANSLGIDEETRVLILKKTWCHGQLVLPAFSVFYLYLFFASVKNFILLFAAIVLPIWSYLSYQKMISSTKAPSPHFFWMLATLAQVAHVGVFVYSLQAEETNLLLTISSGLFFVETIAFLLVVRALGNSESRQQEQGFQDLDDGAVATRLV